VDHSSVWFITAEDLILAKLLWALDSHSEMQIKDIRNLLATRKEKRLTTKYMKHTKIGKVPVGKKTINQAFLSCILWLIIFFSVPPWFQPVLIRPGGK